jgi:hypothetical protein
LSNKIHDVEPLPFKWTRGSRKHRIGKAHARYVIANHEAVVIGDVATWIGFDDRGAELEIIAIRKPDCFLVIHVFPVALRGGQHATQG